MTINEAMRLFHLPNPTSQEDLECRWSKVLEYGDRVLVAGHFYQHGGPCYYGAVYEHLDDDMSCEGAIGLRSVSDVDFIDAGHAMEWAIRQE